MKYTKEQFLEDFNCLVTFANNYDDVGNWQPSKQRKIASWLKEMEIEIKKNFDL